MFKVAAIRLSRRRPLARVPLQTGRICIVGTGN